MEHRYPSVEFEVEIEPGGTLTLPKGIAALVVQGERVTVKLTQGVVSRRLRSRSVTEEELEQIAMTQLEARDNVVLFLEAEGALSASRRFDCNSLTGRKVRS